MLSFSQDNHGYQESHVRNWLSSNLNATIVKNGGPKEKEKRKQWVGKVTPLLRTVMLKYLEEHKGNNKNPTEEERSLGALTDESSDSESEQDPNLALNLTVGEGGSSDAPYEHVTDTVEEASVVAGEQGSNNPTDPPVSGEGSRRTSKILCPICNKSFKNKNTLSNHKNLQHKQQGVQCKSCKKTFGRPANLKRHMQGSYKCARFRGAVAKSKAQKKVFCTVCESGFINQKNLRRHNKGSCWVKKRNENENIVKN